MRRGPTSRQSRPAPPERGLRVVSFHSFLDLGLHVSAQAGCAHAVRLTDAIRIKMRRAASRGWIICSLIPALRVGTRGWLDRVKLRTSASSNGIPHPLRRGACGDISLVGSRAVPCERLLDAWERLFSPGWPSSRYHPCLGCALGLSCQHLHPYSSSCSRSYSGS
jgi:hypothetical protein